MPRRRYNPDAPPSPEATLLRVRAAAHDAEALERLRKALDRAWRAGHKAGWDDFAADADDVGEVEVTRSPYPNPYDLSKEKD